MGIDYKGSGVDQDRADRLISGLLANINSTLKPWVMSGVGGFSALFKVPSSYRKPVLAVTTDGVGTKVKLAVEYGYNFNVGVDLVAMNVNDLLCVGADPLVFLDYIATESLNEKVYREIISGVVDGCKMAGCSLVGGETAQMPGMYQKGEYDLAGFAVGVVEEEEIITGEKIAPGNVVLGLTSSGLHSNGFSLIRRLLDDGLLEADKTLSDEKTFIECVIEPTIIYVDALREVKKSGVDVKGVVNITGGGFYGNIPRVLPEGVSVRIYRDRWRVPEVFLEIQRAGDVSDREMFYTFNMGIGMVIIIDGRRTIDIEGVDFCIIGEVVEGDKKVEIV